MSKPKLPPATRIRARELLAESSRLELELARLIGRLTAFTDQLQDQLQAQGDDQSGGDYGPGSDGGLVR